MDKQQLAHNRKAWDWLTAENNRLREALKEIRTYAEAHHKQQPNHVLLHSLTIDIPARVAFVLREKKS